MKSQHFWLKNAFLHPNIVPAKKCSAKNYICKTFEKKTSYEPTENKKQFSNSFTSETKKVFFRYELKINQEFKTSSAGNRTPVSNVTGWDTHHYTSEDTVPSISAKFVPYEILKLQNDTNELDQRSGILLYTAA